MRLILSFCLLLAAGVAVNVLALQDNVPSAGLDVPVASRANSPGDDGNSGRTEARRLILAIKRELASRHYISAPVHGEVDLAARAAILAYEIDHGFPLTATPSDDLFKAILLGSVAASRSLAAPSEAARDVVARVQRALAHLGYGRNEITGTLDDETKSAILAFQRARGLRPNGLISARLIEHLGPAIEQQVESSGLHDRASAG